MNLFSIDAVGARPLIKQTKALEFNHFVKLLPSLTGWIVAPSQLRHNDAEVVWSYDTENHNVRLVLNIEDYLRNSDVEVLLRSFFSQKHLLIEWLTQFADINPKQIDLSATRIIVVASEFSDALLEEVRKLQFVELWRTDLYEGDVLDLTVVHRNPNFLCTGWEEYGSVECDSTTLLELVGRIPQSEAIKKRENPLIDVSDYIHILQTSSFLAAERPLHIESDGLDAVLGYSQPYKSWNRYEAVAREEELVTWLNTLGTGTTLRLESCSSVALNAIVDGQAKRNLPGDPTHRALAVLGYEVPKECLQVPVDALRDCIQTCYPCLLSQPMVDDVKQYLDLEITYKSGQGSIVALATNGYALMRMERKFETDRDDLPTVTFRIPSVCAYELLRVLDCYDGWAQLGKISHGEWIGVGRHYVRYPFPRKDPVNYQAVLNKVKDLPSVGHISVPDFHMVIDLERLQLERNDVKFLMLKKVSKDLFAFHFLSNGAMPRCTKLNAEFSSSMGREDKFEVALNPSYLLEGIGHLLNGCHSLEICWSPDDRVPVCFKPKGDEGWVYMQMPTRE